MLLNKEEKASLLKWAYENSYAEDMFHSYVAPFNDKIYIDLGLVISSYEQLTIRVRTERQASSFSKWLFGQYTWVEIHLNEDGPWWDEIRNELPKLIEQDEKDKQAKELKRKNKLSKLAEEYSSKQ